MANNSVGVEKQLEKIQSIINSGTDSLSCTNLEASLGLEVPREVCNVIVRSAEINSLSDSIFLGYEVVSYEVLINSYQKMSQSESIFKYLGVNENLDLTPETQFYFVESSSGFIDEPVDVTNIKGMIPLLQINGEIMFYNLNSIETFGGLISVVDGQASVVAPSISDHIEDLLMGFKRGIYPLDNGRLVFPASWHYRQKLKEGLVEMSEYGEIIDTLNDKTRTGDENADPGFLKKWLNQWK